MKKNTKKCCDSSILIIFASSQKAYGQIVLYNLHGLHHVVSRREIYEVN